MLPLVKSLSEVSSKACVLRQLKEIIAAGSIPTKKTHHPCRRSSGLPYWAADGVCPPSEVR